MRRLMRFVWTLTPLRLQLVCSEPAPGRASHARSPAVVALKGPVTADMSDDALTAKTSQRVVPPWIMPTRKCVKGIVENPASLASVVSRLGEPGWNVVALVQRAAA